MAKSVSTAAGSSLIRSRQSGASGCAGSATASRPRGASRVGEHVEPAVPADVQPVRASTPCCTTRSAGAAGPVPLRSASHTSLRGAVPCAALIISHRPSRLTETP